MPEKRYELLLQLSTGNFDRYDEATAFTLAFKPGLRWAVRDRQTGAIYDPALEPNMAEPRSLRVT